MARRRTRGNFRELLKRLPETVADELRAQLEDTGKLVLGRQKARAPVYQGKPRKGLTPGALREGLSYKVLPKSLRLRVGLVGKATNRKLFYGRFVQFGRKAKTVIANRSGKGIRVSGHKWRRQAEAKGVKGFYKLRVRAMAPRNFIWTTPRDVIARPFQKIWGRAIHRAKQGSADD